MGNIETIRENLNSKQIKSLIHKLNDSGFYVSESGHVGIENPKTDHPYWGAGIVHYLPVGFIGKDYAEIVNTEKEFPEDYHAQLRDIYRSI